MEYYKLSNRNKIIAIIVVITIFICTAAVCLKLENRTYDYTFNLKDMEFKTAEFIDGEVHSGKSSEDYIFATKPFILPPEGYVIEIIYTSSADGSVLVQGNNDCVFDIQLPPTYGEEHVITDARLILPNGTDRGKIKFYQNSDGEMDVKNIRIVSPSHIYNDYYVLIAFSGILAALMIVLILVFNKLRLSRIGLSYIGLMIIALVIVNIPFCINGTYYEVDTQAHLKRIEALSQGIRDGQFPVIIGPNYANQYGELVALQPGLFLYIPAFLRLLNISVPTAYNIYMILVNIATAVATVVCAERLFTSMRWGIVAAVFYLVEPFRMLVMLKLGAGAGMGTALIFLPFLITGLHETLNRGGFRWKYISVGLWGLICSHIMGFALSFVTMIIYILFHIKKLRDKDVLFALVKAAVWFLVLSVGILVPFAGYYFSDWNRGALQWTDFYNHPIDVPCFMLDVIAMAVLVISYIGARRTGYITRFVKGIFIIGFVSLTVASPFFPWQWFKMIPGVDTFLSMMQYPQRFHFITVPCVGYTAAEAVCSNMDSRTGIRRRVTFTITALLGIGVIMNLYLFYKPEKLFNDLQSGEINTLMEDYLPAGTLTEWYANDTGDFSDYDEVTAYSYSKINTHIDCTYTADSEGQYMEFPLFYYDGYEAFDQNGIPLKVERGERNRVRVYLTKSDEIQELHLKFGVRRLYTFAFIFSLVSGFIWFIYNVGFLAIRSVRSKRVTL